MFDNIKAVKIINTGEIKFFEDFDSIKLYLNTYDDNDVFIYNVDLQNGWFINANDEYNQYFKN